MTLIQLSAPLTVTDGGLETTLVFHHGIDLPDFAAFPLLDTEVGRAALADYYQPYLDLGRRLGTPVVVDTPTWRANLDWGARLGYDAIRLAAVNRRAVEFVRELATSGAGGPVEHVVDGVDRPTRRRLRGRRDDVGVRGGCVPRPAGPRLRRGRRGDDDRRHDDVRRRGDRRGPSCRLGRACPW